LQARKQEKHPNKTTLVLTFDPLLELGWLVAYADFYFIFNFNFLETIWENLEEMCFF
jgi:hypothetical protein